MKKLLLVLSLLLGVCNLQAKSLFDLHEQYFKNTILNKDGKFTAEGRYELPNVFVSTNTYFKDGVYHPTENSPGYFSIDIKNSPTHWKVITSVYHHNYPTILRVTSKNGKSNIVTLSGDGKLQINSEEYKSTIGSRNTQMTFEYSNQTLTVYFNGQAAFKEEQKESEGLKKVEILLKGYSADSYRAKLASLQIFDGN